MRGEPRRLNLQSHSLLRAYGTNLPTSLAARSPKRPEASNLDDRMRIRVHLHSKLKKAKEKKSQGSSPPPRVPFRTSNPLDFHGPTVAHRTTAKERSSALPASRPASRPQASSHGAQSLCALTQESTRTQAKHREKGGRPPAPHAHSHTRTSAAQERFSR